MNLRWALNRMRAMGVREIAHRGVQSVHGRLQRAGFDLARPRSAGPARGKPWLAAWPSSVLAQPYLAAADRIVDGHFRLFGDREWTLGMPPDWNRDPQSGARAPLTFGKALNYRDAALVGNIKYLWEPNRHLELVTLAQAWHLSGESRYAQACRMLVDSWIEQCPYMRGANWTSSLELALRLTNWSCAWYLLGGEDSLLFQADDGRLSRRAGSRRSGSTVISLQVTSRCTPRPITICWGSCWGCSSARSPGRAGPRVRAGVRAPRRPLRNRHCCRMPRTGSIASRRCGISTKSPT